MSNDKEATYERLFKLWATVWGLVLNNKRVLETVCAVLQRLVFDKTEWPRYKYWPEICRLDNLSMLAVSTAPLPLRAEIPDLTRRLIAAFPECFSSVKVRGPVPLSVLKRVASENFAATGESGGTDWLVSWEATTEFNIPVTSFPNRESSGRRDLSHIDHPSLPKEIPIDSEVGRVVRWMNRDWVVVDNCTALWIAPAECIDVFR